MSSLTFDRLSKSYAAQEAVRSVSLTIAEGEFLSLLGPSGCGKTTILRMAAGLVTPSAGRVLIGDDDVTDLAPNRRDIGLVFQSYALFPHLTVFENVAFGLRRRKIGGEELNSRVCDALAQVRLQAHGDRLPQQLSGGQQQRVAVARALAPRPRVLLLDEPLSNLDAQLREEMQIELKRLHRSLGVTTCLVTHDQGEALSMSDRVCVMAAGAVQQIASPEDIYHRPATAFVAGFIGRPNRLSGTVVARDGEAGTLRLKGGWVVRAARVEQPVGAAVDIVIRQEAIRISLRAAPDELRGEIALRSFSGARVQYVVRLPGGDEVVGETGSSDPEADLSVGAAVTVSVESSAVFSMAASA